MKKLSALMLLSATMILASCGKPAESKPEESKPAETSQNQGESTPVSEPASKPASSSSQAPASSSQAPASSSKPASSSQAPASSSQQAEATVTFTKLDLVSENNKTYIKLTGTIAGLSGNAAKFALGLSHKEVSSVDDGTAGWIVGSATPAAADYKYAPTIAADGTFEVKLDVSGVTFAAGAYSVWAGPQGKYADVTAALVGQSGGTSTGNYGGTKAKVTGYKLYFRDDVDALIADALPPVELAEAFFEAGTGEDAGKTYILIGGELGETAAAFQAHTPFLQFQVVGGSWTTTRLDNQEGKVELVVRGTKGYVRADISGLAEGNYNTHLNITAKSQADCKMDVNLDTKATPWVNGTKGYAVYSNTAASAQAEFWGNLGVIISHAHQLNRAEAKTEGTDMWPVSCPSNDLTGVEMDLDSTNTPTLGADKKMNSSKAATFNITGLPAGEYEVYIKAHVTNGNHTTTTAHGMSYGEGITEAVPGRYYAQLGDANGAKVYTETGNKNFNAIGLDDPNTFKWTNTPVIASMMIGAGETAFRFVHTGLGYSLYVESIRLVRVGNYMPPAKNVTFTNGVYKQEAEDYAVKHTIFTSTGEETDYVTDGTTYPVSLNGTVTDDAAASGGKYVHAIFREGWNGTKRSNMSGELQYRVKLAADANVKIKAKIKSDMETEKVCFDLKVDGQAKGTLNAANEWVEVESAAMTLTAGVHTISFIGQQLGSSENYRSVLADIDCWSFVEQAA